MNASRLAGEKVIVVGHVPPGVFERTSANETVRKWLYPAHNERYVKLVQSNCDIIVAQLFGHEHNDAFKLIFTNENATSICNAIMIHPSIAPFSGSLDVNSSNPGIRLYSYDNFSYQLQNYTQYFANLSLVNTWSINRTIWTVEVCT